MISEIIAEVGSNFRTFEDALESIRVAARCGATAVKFQLFCQCSLYGYTDGLDPYSLPLDWLDGLKVQADSSDVKLFCTAFSPELVAVVDPFVSMHKIASSDLCYPQLLRAVAATGKPILLSTGAASESEIQQALDCLGGAAVTRTTLLYCVAAYPARTSNTDTLFTLRNRFGLRVGISDHSREILETAINAQRAGAVVIEKHFTAFPELETPDRPHSLTSDEFLIMCDFIRKPRAPIGPTFEEVDMLLMHRRRLITTRAVAAGETLVYGENYGAYRSREPVVGATSPFRWEEFEGRRASRALRRGCHLIDGDRA